MGNASQRLLVLGAFSDVRWLPEHLFEIEQVDSQSEALKLLGERQFDLALLNIAISDGSALDIFGKARVIAPRVPLVVLARPEDEELALGTLQLGAQDYFLVTEPNKLLLVSVIRKAIERHRAQESPRRDQHLLEILMTKMPDAIYFKDTDSRFLRISRAHARRFGLEDPALAIGKTDADFFIGQHAQEARANELQVMKTGQPLVGIEEKETWPDGTVSWVSTTKMALRDPAGRVVGAFRHFPGHHFAQGGGTGAGRTHAAAPPQEPADRRGAENGPRTATGHAAAAFPASPHRMPNTAPLSSSAFTSPADRSAATFSAWSSFQTRPSACSSATSWDMTSGRPSSPP